MKRAGAGWWLAVMVLCLLGGALLSAGGWLPFERVKALADGLSPDGNFKILTPFAMDELRLPLAFGRSAVGAGCGGLAGFSPQNPALPQQNRPGLARSAR